MKRILTLIVCAISLNAVGQVEDCQASPSFFYQLLGGQQDGISDLFGGSLTEITFNLDFEGGGDNYASDLWFSLYAPNGACVVGGGGDEVPSADNFSALNSCQNLSVSGNNFWPDDWDSLDNGSYTFTLDVESQGLEGAGMWTLSFYNSRLGACQSNYLIEVLYQGICWGGQISGCSDPLACNFNAASIDDGTCHYDCQFCLEGTVWSEELGGCVVANVSDTDFDGCVGINDFLVHLSNFGGGCGPEPAWACGDPLEYQGYDYETVQIGEQCWFAENLRSENYRNCDSILSGLSQGEWNETLSGAQTVLDGNDDNFSLYGRLYNWYAVDDSRDLCPIDWHVPSDSEWTILTTTLGGLEIAGGKMKTTYGWVNAGNGTNVSGFSALPGRGRNNSGFFDTPASSGYWWSSSQYDAELYAWRRNMWSGSETIQRAGSDRTAGFSVRCIKDTE